MVEQDAPKGSSGPGSVSLTIGSGTLAIVGLVVVVTLGAIAAASN